MTVPKMVVLLRDAMLAR